MSSGASPRPLKRKDIVLIDNLPAHKAAGVREAIARERRVASHLKVVQ
jgi:hypothetical protein